jgi:hypothetical protein
MNKLLLIMVMALTFSVNALAQNDLYGTVGDIFYRAGNNVNDPAQLYFRLNVTSGTTESCILNSSDITWHVDLDSKLSDKIISVLEKSREEAKEVRILGMHDVCSGGTTETDNVFEIIPNWQPTP